MTVSVVVPAFNSRRFLREAVLGLLDEALSDLQVIVVDDASTDDCLETISDLPVTCVRLKENVGPAAARNAGLSQATGSKIAFLDSDDLLEPGGLRWRADWLDAHPEENAIFGSIFTWVDGAGKAREYTPDFRRLHASIPDLVTWAVWKKDGPFAAPVTPTMFRAEVFRELGNFDETLRWAEDTDFMCRYLKQYHLPHRFRPVFRYRLHDENISVRQSKGGILCGTRESEAHRILVEMSYGALKSK